MPLAPESGIAGPNNIAMGLLRSPTDRSASSACATGALAFLFTDIEGSTQRWEANLDEMRGAVERHDAIVRESIERYGGRVFKTVGDAYCAVFTSPVAAITAALCAQRNLLAEDFSAVGGLSVRMGLHSGPADERDNDYFGPTLNRVARLMSSGHGGQILLSDALHSAIADAGQCQFIDLGMRRLKDLREPEHIWQATTLGLPHGFPPLNTLDARPNNLPIQATHLLGREADVDEIEGLLANHRLVTLCGTGGIGKTRLALQVGADLIDRYSHGVWFVDLALINDGVLIESVIAKVLGIAQPNDAPLSDAIVHGMQTRNVLVILDNCEHVIDEVAQIADLLLRRCALTTILATSRQQLDVAGEEVLRIPSLGVPSSIDDLTASEAMRFGAVALFVERARAAHQTFGLVDENVRIVGDICRRLDGIPLALELAAARVRVLTLPHIAQGLNARFKILTHGSRTALPRHKTLSALIDWSYNLLTEAEQSFFDRLAVFSGDFTIEAAAVCGGELDEATVIELLSSLTDKSLVVAETSGEVEYYCLLESTRAYGLEKLTARGECDETARRHALYYLNAVDEARPAERRPDRRTALERQFSNIRAAIAWGLEGGDVVLGATIAGSLGTFWNAAGLEVEGRRWILKILERLDEDAHPLVAARLWRSLAWITTDQQMYKAADRSRVLFEKVGDSRGAGHALRISAYCLMQMGSLEAADVAIEQAMQLLCSGNDDTNLADCLNIKGLIAKERGDAVKAREFFNDAMAQFQQRDRHLAVLAVLGNLGELAFSTGDAAEAERYVNQALAVQSGWKDTWDRINGYADLATYRVALGNLDGAKEAAREALRLAQAGQNSSGITDASQNLALVSALRGDPARAARLMGYVDAAYRHGSRVRQFTEKWGWERLNAALRTHISESEIAELAAQGEGWSEDQAIAEAMSV